MSGPNFETLAIHAGAQPDPATGARATPIYQTTSFVFDDVDHAASLFGLQQFGNIYTRIMNPTQAVLEERVAALEGGTAALAVASGHAAQLIVFQTLMQPGRRVRRLAQALWRLDQPVRPRLQVVRLAGEVGRSRGRLELRGGDHRQDQGDLHRIDRQSRRRRRRHRRHRRDRPASTASRSIVDNTMATPYLCRPIEHGADIVVHSLTKFMGGHGNSMGGAIVDAGTFDWSASGRYPMLSEPRPEYNGIVLHETFGNFAFAIACRVLGLRDLGPAISPFNAFMILTGIETLPLRMQRHCDNALEVASMAEGPRQGRLGLLCGPAGRSLARDDAEILAQGRRRRLHLRPEGRLRGRRHLRRRRWSCSRTSPISATPARW